ncbi:uncharacterized protein LOC135961764 [Calliphora vicina]|uniref:uncharacterized protein LOC135961764 n=1 Tax=Calliphora vicina TaxID=7373 RepID=UPI00325AC934
MKTFQTPQDPNIHESLDLTCHSSFINQYQSAVEDGDAGKEEEEKSYFIKCQENNLKLQNNQNLKLKNKLKNDLVFQAKKEIIRTYTPTYTNLHSYKKQGNGNLSNLSIYDSPYQYLSRAADKFDDTSHYTSCCTDNGISSRKSNIEYSYGKYLELIEHNFEICCTPEICDNIFESVLKSKIKLGNQFVVKSEQNLTSEILMHPHISDNNCDNSCKERTANISHAKFNFPYRTVSHFGFNSPMREPQPDHKHVAVNSENEHKYVAVRRSVSYEEIFSSPRYLNLCEYCFERVVRLKPELMKYKIKLHNLTEQSNSEENDVTVDTVSSINYNQYSPGNDPNESFSIFSFQMDPVVEVEEKRSSNDNFLASDKTNSTFNEKITRMNYSGLNSNSDYINTPHTVSSEYSIPELEDVGFKSSTDLKKITSTDKVADYANNNYNNSNSHHSLTEIYDCNNYIGAGTATNKLFITTELNSESFENTVKIQNFKENSHKLMNREDRSRRKLEFQELWEDHVNFAENRENVEDLSLYSDTKSVVNKSPNNVSKMKPARHLFNLHQQGYNEVVEEYKSTLSRLKFNSTERRKTENILSFPTKGSMNIRNNGVVARKTNKPECYQKSENDYKLDDLNKVSQVSKLNKSSDTALADSKSAVAFTYNICSENTDKFSPLERRILEKIHVNELSKSEEIFGKIENTIRNKITPSMLELIIKEQSLPLLHKNKDNGNKVILMKPKSDKSCLLTPLRFNTSTPKYKLNKTLSFPKDFHKNTIEDPRVNKKSATESHYVRKSNINKNTKCRNFILENIRNVSIPRQKPQIKRLQSNIDPKNGKFYSFTCEKNLVCSPKRRQQLISSRNSGSSAVYSFQSKLVKGSPRFWISMSQISTNKSQLHSSPSTKTAPTPTKKHSKSINSTLSLAAIDNEVVNNVDAEINALGDEIQQIQPRLENYKRKLDDFGNRVTECVNNINECVTTQEDITSVQQKLKDCIELHQYTEEIMCRVETFSLSETED